MRSDTSQRPGDGCVVLLHGFTGSAASWAPLRAALRGKRRIVALDLPGHGATRMDGGRFDYTLARTADAVVEALAAIGVARFAAVGYSMGGRVALQLALAHPRRVERLVLESASPGLPTAAARARRRRADEALAARIEARGIAAFVAHWESRPLLRSLASLPEPLRLDLRRQRLACSTAGLAASLRGMGAGAQPWLGGRLRELAMPVLVVAGAADRKFARVARGVAGRLPGARLALIEGAGHAPHLEQPRAFLRALRPFLDALPAGARHIPEEDQHADRMA